MFLKEIISVFLLSCLLRTKILGSSLFGKSTWTLLQKSAQAWRPTSISPWRKPTWEKTFSGHLLPQRVTLYAFASLSLSVLNGKLQQLWEPGMGKFSLWLKVPCSGEKQIAYHSVSCQHAPTVAFLFWVFLHYLKDRIILRYMIESLVCSKLLQKLYIFIEW